METELFVTALGASSCIFVCAVADQKVENFIKGNIKAFEYYGGFRHVSSPIILPAV